VLSRAAASRAVVPEEAWMLRQAKRVRASYVRGVLDVPGDRDLLAQIWMLRQTDPVRTSYIQHVLEPQLEH
jgi:hypothetical protein